MEKINTKEISVVVQGSIIGSTKNNDKNGYTYICLKSIRKYLPGATIILSTWEGSNTENLDYDVLIKSKDPGSNMMGIYNSNCFRQITSSINGLEACKTKYSIKMRTDFELRNNNFLDYFLKYNQLSFDQNYKILKQKVVTLTTCNPNRRTKWPFNVCDWFFFGLTEDVINIFDIPLVNKQFTRKNNMGDEYVVYNPYSPEQYIWFNFLSKYKQIFFNDLEDISNDNIKLSERYFANNCILLSAERAGIKWLKFPGAAYAQMPCLSNSGLYTFNEYKKLLNKYANNNLIIFPNILEEFVYFIVYNLRFIVKQTYLKLKDVIIKK